jgi:hypothetical protein
MNDLDRRPADIPANDAEAPSQAATPPVATGLPPDPTGSWPSRVGARTPLETGPTVAVGDAPAEDTGGFTPRAAIVPHAGRNPISEPQSVVQARLRELPLIYILILATSTLWTRAVLGQEDRTLYRIDAIVIMLLVGIVAMLWSRWSVPLAWLKALELGMIGMLAGRVAFVQYRMMLAYSLSDDPMLAQLTMKNVVLLTSNLRALRPEELAPCRDRGGATRPAPFRDLAGPHPEAPRGDRVAGARLEEE